ncbi:hypothetical protein AVEN_252086-1, partial [Araneus ventricosus]
VKSGSLPTLKKLKPFAYFEISIYVALQTETGPLFVGVEWKFGEWRDKSFVLVIGQHSKLRAPRRPISWIRHCLDVIEKPADLSEEKAWINIYSNLEKAEKLQKKQSVKHGCFEDVTSLNMRTMTVLMFRDQ